MAKQFKKNGKKTRAAEDTAVSSLADLVGMDKDEWSGTPASKGFVPFPPGRGQTARIEDVAVGESKAGNPLVTFVLVGTSNENKGLRDWKRNMLMSKDNRAHLRGEMETIGLTWPDDPRELGESLDEAKGLEVKFDVIDRDEFHNIYFTDVMGEPESAEEAEEEAEEAEEAEEEENETPQYTKKEIKVMKPKALNALAEDLDLDPDDYDDTDDLRKAVMEALEL